MKIPRFLYEEDYPSYNDLFHKKLQELFIGVSRWDKTWAMYGWVVGLGRFKKIIDDHYETT